MDRRIEWRKVLDAEIKRWSAMSYDELIAALHEHQEYQVESDTKQYNVQVEVLEITEKYLHVVVAVVAAVGDGVLPASIRPLSRSFFCPTS